MSICVIASNFLLIGQSVAKIQPLLNLKDVDSVGGRKLPFPINKASRHSLRAGATAQPVKVLHDHVSVRSSSMRSFGIGWLVGWLVGWLGD